MTEKGKRSQKLLHCAIIPALLVGCSAVSAIIYCSPYTYFNLILSVVLLCVVLFTKQAEVTNRMKFSALWFLLLEVLALSLLIFGENLYEPSTVWCMYALLAVLDIFITPLISKRK